ncbi:hypothetical protein [Cylindrospermum sp. FACHB-282]|uniref:hypothetical protein n=1 Tax=Cylindrospermum sp. FACHB-282 TaxID=2692794 RepID=UPI001682350F|nr:hypothetical protein [Cylindrospermum sp. FACHB-282]MBD2386417.1 hypothetical protein [Cylindrospermum sp. FACHB-282]
MNPESRKRNHSLWFVACSCWVLTSNSLNYPAYSQNLTPYQSKGENEKIKSSCSEQNLETLITQLLRDLPNYTNRATQRARRLSRRVDLFSYMLVAGKPEFTPLPLNPGGNTANEYQSEGVEQVFFTTLERQYINKQAVELQQFHRLLLTKTQSGWAVVMMFTQTGSYSKEQTPSPPRDSSNSAVAQGVKLWLRDCQAGSVRSGFSRLED